MRSLIRILLHVLAGVALLSAVLDIGDATVASAAPVVTGVSPNSGPASGGTTITITGSGFVNGARVLIGQGYGVLGQFQDGVGLIAATNVVFVSSSELTATTGGPAIAGTFSVFVIQNGGHTSSGGADSDFTYTPVGATPTVTNVSPDSGPFGGVTPITITGTGFTSPATVVIGQGHGTNGAIRATNVDVVSSTKITATAGVASKTGRFSLYVNTSGGTSTASGSSNYTYTPTVISVTNSTGPTSGGTDITIRGTGFQSPATVLIGQGNGTTGAIAATSVNVVSLGKITATSGGGAKAGTFTLFVITNNVASPGNLAAHFTYTG
jgi:hypothetical protein